MHQPAPSRTTPAAAPPRLFTPTAAGGIAEVQLQRIERYPGKTYLYLSWWDGRPRRVYVGVLSYRKDKGAGRSSR